MARLTINGVKFYLTSRQFSKKTKLIRDVFDCKFDKICSVNIDLVKEEPESSIPNEMIYSNDLWFDMSAYGAAIDKQSTSDAFLYFNDTLFVKHCSGIVLERIRDCADSVASSPFPTAVGAINPSTDAIFHEGGYRSSKHLSTFCFMLNNSANRIFEDILLSLPDFEDSHDWLRSKYQEYPALERVLYLNVFAPHNPWSWAGRSHNLRSDFLRRKAVSVSVEHILSAEIIKSGGVLLPTNYGYYYKFCRVTKTFITGLKLIK
tara:strand:- start:9233 stop:10018 length:786 start_codon:yes stop_codon:yes gene_type:complete